MFCNQHIHSNQLNNLILAHQRNKPSNSGDHEPQPYSWNNDDRSLNACIKSNGAIFYREPVAYYTDAVRGRRFFESRVNVWKITWSKQERGTHAMVGVATDQMSLQAPGYVQLVGSDPHSWGFDLVNKSLHHNGKIISSAYPDNKSSIIPDEIIVVLDMDSGTLCFASEQGHCYGIAFSGLKDKKLFPAISSVWGQCNVAIQYLGSIQSQPPSLLASCRQKLLDSMKSIEVINHYQENLPSRLADYVTEYNYYNELLFEF